MHKFVLKIARQFSLLNNFINNLVFQMGFMLLKINLCISDLTLILMAVINCIWLLTYQWPGGDALCRLSQVVPLTERTIWLVRNSWKSRLFANTVGNRNAWIYILLKETQFKTFNIFPIFYLWTFSFGQCFACMALRTSWFVSQSTDWEMCFQPRKSLHTA